MFEFVIILLKKKIVYIYDNMVYDNNNDEI